MANKASTKWFPVTVNMPETLAEKLRVNARSRRMPRTTLMYLILEKHAHDELSAAEALKLSEAAA